MFTLPNLPTQSSKTCELCDFFELLAIKNGQVSKAYLANHLSIASDNLYNSGCDDEDEQIAAVLDAALIELERRLEACGNEGYPFTLNPTGTLLTYLGDDIVQQCCKKMSYIYLLLSTRLNMKGSRTHANIDGTTILEDLAAIVIKSYLGSRACSINFGTSVAGGFGQKIDSLCLKFGEGGRHHKPAEAARHTQDGKLDTVGWIPFSDNLQGKLSVFAQCKTGTSWQDSVCQLQPECFVKKFMTGKCHINPIRAFFVSESVDRSRWHDLTIDAGLLFDRCRIIDFCPDLPEDILNKTRSWTEAALSTVSI